MTYAEAIKFLYDLRWFGAKFGLENTRQLAARAGDPQNQLRFIHVAGTIGKTNYRASPELWKPLDALQAWPANFSLACFREMKATFRQ